MSTESGFYSDKQTLVLLGFLLKAVQGLEDVKQWPRKSRRNLSNHIEKKHQRDSIHEGKILENWRINPKKSNMQTDVPGKKRKRKRNKRNGL